MKNDSKIVTRRDNCRGCFSKNLFQVLDLGEMPLAGGFITESEAPFEKKFPLRIYFCGNCRLFQILDVINPDILFKNYFYISSVIPAATEHFKQYAEFLKSNYFRMENPVLLEFGCNDGVLLQNFANDKNIKAIGIDPSVNVGELGRKRGLNIITDYFNSDSAKKFVKEHGQADVVTGMNVFAHADDIREIIKAAKIALKPSGVFIVEIQYLGSLLRGLQYPKIYHEHFCYYSLTALKNILEFEGMKIIGAELFPDYYSGELRCTATFKENRIEADSSVENFLQKEKKLDSVEPFLKFAEDIAVNRKEIRAFLRDIKRQGKRIVGYGAPGNGTIFLNYCGIDSSLLDYIVDISPLRAGRLMPGVHIPIFPLEKARDNPPDYFFVLAYDYIESILSQEEGLAKKGVKFIVPLPKLKII